MFHKKEIADVMRTECEIVYQDHYINGTIVDIDCDEEDAKMVVMLDDYHNPVFITGKGAAKDDFKEFVGKRAEFIVTKSNEVLFNKFI